MVYYFSQTISFALSFSFPLNYLVNVVDSYKLHIFSEISCHAYKNSLQDEQQRCLGGRTNQQFSSRFMRLSSFHRW